MSTEPGIGAAPAAPESKRRHNLQTSQEQDNRQVDNNRMDLNNFYNSTSAIGGALHHAYVDRTGQKLPNPEYLHDRRCQTVGTASTIQH